MNKSFLIAALCAISVTTFAQIRCGAERTELYYSYLRNKNIAIVANAASLVGNVNVVDTLLQRGLKVEKIFCPEHGFRVYSEAGQTLKNSIDSATKIPVVSLYGKKRRPDPSDLKNVDIVVFDLQDVGVRCYTYLSTLSYMMEACSQANIPLMVFDRPNPNGFFIDGPVMDSSLFSFIGLHLVPLVYGMTIGEYAKMINEEGWLKGGMICDLQVIPLENYTHQTQYMLPVNPSPNLKSMTAVYLYPSLCLFEGTIISVGRGTLRPFEVFGHPDFTGVSYNFTPVQADGFPSPLYAKQVCYGLDLHDFFKTHADQTGRLNLTWLIMAYNRLGKNPHFFNEMFDKLAGTTSLRNEIIAGKTEQEIRLGWQEGLGNFKVIRKKYLIYPE